MYLGRSPRRPAALLGGVGFGFFIDELGKFVTEDNNYFYKPAAGVIYVVFIAIFLIIRYLARGRDLSDEERAANAIYLAIDAAHGRLHEHDRERAVALLQGADRRPDRRWPRCATCSPSCNGAARRPRRAGTSAGRARRRASTCGRRAGRASRRCRHGRLRRLRAVSGFVTVRRRRSCRSASRSAADRDRPRERERPELPARRDELLLRGLDDVHRHRARPAAPRPARGVPLVRARAARVGPAHARVPLRASRSSAPWRARSWTSSLLLAVRSMIHAEEGRPDEVAHLIDRSGLDPVLATPGR